MQPVCRSPAPARPLTARGRGPANAGTTLATHQSRVTAAGRVAPVLPALRLRARRAPCVGAGGSGTAEPVPVEVRAQSVVADLQGGAEPELVAEELESLEEAAIAGEDEGRRPTDYDRRAHIFEESSRVFRELKQRHDGDARGDVQGGGGSGNKTATHDPQQQQQHR